MSVDIAQLQAWIGRQETLHDTVTEAPLRALTATLDRTDAPIGAHQPLPPLWHWLYFLPVARQSEIGEDGHPKRGGFLPPVPLPRRMWAGSQLTFHAPIHAGQALARQSTIADVRLKEGRTGPLVFVKVDHALSADGQLAISERHDIVYRDMPAPDEAAPAPTPAPSGAQWERQIVPDDVLLFRYSALTFNGHRIHYDRQYVTQVEGYPGLIVHGPLLATLLMDLLRRELPNAQVASFQFRAVKPVFDIAPFYLCGRQDGNTVHLWVRSPEGHLNMDATATLA
ncbi:acyl-CoA dehydrogenase [Lampropedia puyangensis]|uniref:Acyl-CoA dehydrogenase n=1 Tax=Lampropedia puyangensis TaxID=1330072 RepID=A0A4S8F0S3_9BURK|nr:MaoC family dehydratase N-terminal domain-containing protein [Lampropedia puyangensis]THT99884.1 acyl-CoA dehydrogenase [Lampropedia puyangensis]